VVGRDGQRGAEHAVGIGLDGHLGGRVGVPGPQEQRPGAGETGAEQAGRHRVEALSRRQQDQAPTAQRRARRRACRPLREQAALSERAQVAHPRDGATTRGAGRSRGSRLNSSRTGWPSGGSR
jgi:hypothetical protein